MRALSLLLIVLFCTGIALADTTVYDAWTFSGDNVTVGDAVYHIEYNNGMVFLNNIFNKVIIKVNDTKTDTFYTYQFSAHETSEDVDIEQKILIITEKVKLTISEKECVEYTIGNNSACKKGLLEECENNYECFANLCVHNVCTKSTATCGDGYCDTREKCTEDCKPSAVLTSENTYAIPADKDWIALPHIFSDRNSYQITTIDNSSLERTKPLEEENNSGTVLGDILLKVGNDIYDGSLNFSSSDIVMVRVNDVFLYDNEGEIVVEIQETRMKPSLPEINTFLKLLKSLNDQKRYDEIASMSVNPAKSFYLALLDNNTIELDIGEYTLVEEGNTYIASALVEGKQGNITLMFNNKLFLKDISTSQSVFPVNTIEPEIPPPSETIPIAVFNETFVVNEKTVILIIGAFIFITAILWFVLSKKIFN